MACIKCGNPLEYFTGREKLYKVNFPKMYVDFECRCDRCDVTFWQRYVFETDDYLYHNLTDAQHKYDLDNDIKVYLDPWTDHVDKAIMLMHHLLPEDFINMIDDDTHNDLVYQLMNYMEMKGWIKSEE